MINDIKKRIGYISTNNLKQIVMYHDVIEFKSTLNKHS